MPCFALALRSAAGRRQLELDHVRDAGPSRGSSPASGRPKPDRGRSRRGRRTRRRRPVPDLRRERLGRRTCVARSHARRAGSSPCRRPSPAPRAAPCCNRSGPSVSTVTSPPCFSLVLHGLLDREVVVEREHVLEPGAVDAGAVGGDLDLRFGGRDALDAGDDFHGGRGRGRGPAARWGDFRRANRIPAEGPREREYAPRPVGPAAHSTSLRRLVGADAHHRRVETAAEVDLAHLRIADELVGGALRAGSGPGG
jgi:hypothetical protein